MSPKKKPGKPKISYRELMSSSETEAEKPKSPPKTPAPVAATPTAPAAPVTEVPETQPATPAASGPQSAVRSPQSDLPPARRRDRSRELTPRELAAVLNVEQMRAAAEKAAAAAEEAAASAGEAYPDDEDASGLRTPHSSSLPPVAEPRSSGEVMSDTMEFAVAAAVATLPFRDRVRARAGIVEVLLFRIGSELFATDLTAAEEAIEQPMVHRVPEMPDQMLGFFSLRGKLLPVFSPTLLLGASLSREHGAAVVLRAGDKRIALAIDDVDDVMPLDLARLRDVPAASDPEGVLLGVAWRETELVSLIDAEALLAACQSEQLVETA